MKIKKDGKFVEVNPKKDKLIGDLEKGKLTSKQLQSVIAGLLKSGKL